MVKKNEIEDPFAFEDDEEESEQAVEAAPEPVNAELEQLREFKASALAYQREAEIADAFEKAGYTGKLAKLWAALNPEGEATAEDVKAFAAEYGVTPARPGGGVQVGLGKGLFELLNLVGWRLDRIHRRGLPSICCGLFQTTLPCSASACARAGLVLAISSISARV